MSVAETRVPKATYYRKKKRYTASEKKAYGIAMKAIRDNEKQEVELKRIYDELTTPPSITTSGLVTNLCQPAQGDGNGERVGDKISMKKLLIRLSLVHQDPTNIIRVMVVKWFEVGSPTVTSILQATSLNQNQPYAPINWNNRHQFRILYDNTFASSTYTNALLVEKIYLKNLGQQQFQLGSTVPEQGSIYLIAVSDSPVSGPTLNLVWSISYTDQ